MKLITTSSLENLSIIELRFTANFKLDLRPGTSWSSVTRIATSSDGERPTPRSVTWRIGGFGAALPVSAARLVDRVAAIVQFISP